MTESTPRAESPAPADAEAAAEQQPPSIPPSPTHPSHTHTPATLTSLPPSKPSPAPPSSANIGGGNNTASAHGAPVRQYLNEFVTPYLLEGMKRLAREQPANPLEVLGKFLMEKSAQVEGLARDTRMGDVD